VSIKRTLDAPAVGSTIALVEDGADASAENAASLAHLSHQLRNPLNTILGMASLLSETELSDEQARFVASLQRAGERLLSLVMSLTGNPAAVDSGEDRVSGALHAAPDGELLGMRVLVVDDSEDNRALVAAYLASTGAVLELVGDATGALDALERTPFDVVLMDLHLPGADGFAATRELRQRERSRGAEPTPVVALSADASIDTLERTRATGFTEHLAKPLHKAALQNLLRRYLPSPARTPSSPARTGAVATLFPRFLVHRERDAATLRDALAREDFPTIATLGHNMHGNGASYGYPELSAIGRRLEAAAATRNAHDVEGELGRLDACVARMRSNTPATVALQVSSSAVAGIAGRDSTPRLTDQDPQDPQDQGER
jgi:CheY-like chemotaxis protein/HPt (histidine-containing phosphotransfer) domain-containing protein